MKSKLPLICILLSVLLLFTACNSNKPPENNVNELTPDSTVQPVSDYALETVAVKDAYGVSYDYADISDYPVSVRYGGAELSQGYKSLTEEAQRILYREMEENVFYIAQKPENGLYDLLDIKIWNAELTEAQIRQVIVAFCQDKPHIFWMDNRFGYANTTGSTILQLYSYLSAEDVESYSAALNSKIQELHLGLLSDMTEYSRELYIHDWLIKNCNYADDVSKVSDDFLSFTSYGALVNQRAVCEGYTRAMQLMLASVGIESFPVIGNGNEGLHMWNGVKIDNEWYYVDSTWNDTEKGSGYDYFNITTEQLLYDHTIMPIYSQLTEEQVCGIDDGVADSFNLIVPVCSATAQNYFVKNSLIVNDLGDIAKENIKTGLRVAQGALTETVTISISADLDFDDTLDELFYSGDYIFFECLDAVNEELEENFFDRNNVSISKKPHLRVVTVILQYTDEV
ncbi:MAG: transglutaminase domain-containing protein [Ruminococcus sp.]|nr:transglutaminase domain-containing protein [Ruminococcus sp.]